jgi:hypothetical protein
VSPPRCPALELPAACTTNTEHNVTSHGAHVNDCDCGVASHWLTYPSWGGSLGTAPPTHHSLSTMRHAPSSTHHRRAPNTPIVLHVTVTATRD